MTVKQRKKEMNAIAVPLMMQSIAGLVIGLIDQAMIGRISLFAFGAVGTIAALLYTFAGILGYVSVAFNIRAAKTLGGNNKGDFYQELANTLILNIFIGLLFVLVMLLFKREIIIILFKFTGQTLEESLKYMAPMQFYLLIQLLLFNFSAYFKVKKQTKWIFYGATLAAVLNTVLNYVFIFGKAGFPKMGVYGAGLASIASLSVNLLIYVFAAKDDIKIAFERAKLGIARIKSIIAESLPLMGQELVESSLFVLALNALLARAGILELSGYLLVARIISIALMPAYMYGTACLTLIGEKFGQKDDEYLNNMPQIALFHALFFYMILGLIFITFKNHIPGVLTNDADLILYASGLVLPLVLINGANVCCQIFKYCMQAVNMSKFVLYATAKINGISFLVMLGLFNIFKYKMLAVYMGLMLNYILLTILLMRKYYSRTTLKSNTCEHKQNRGQSSVSSK